MSIGAFGENFPYSNFHDLNMDWIIKIAKDFLDQYTTIQDTISSGLEQIGDKTEESLTSLEEKKDALEASLNQWYDTHSEDIENQLASALADLTQEINRQINYINSQIDAKAETTLASIPADYSALASQVSSIALSMRSNPVIGTSFTVPANTGHASTSDQILCAISNGSKYSIKLTQTAGRAYRYVFYNSDSTTSAGSWRSANSETLELTAVTNIVAIGIEVTAGSGTSASYFNVEVTQGELGNLLSNLAYNSNEAITSVSFTALTSTGHSATNDQISVHIEPNDKYFLRVKQTNNRAYRIHFIGSNQTSISSWRNGNLEEDLLVEANNDTITAIGFEVSASGGQSEFVCTVAQNPLGGDLTYNLFQSYSQYHYKNAVAFGTSLTARTISYMAYLPDISGMSIANHGVSNGQILDDGEHPSIMNEITSYTGYADKDVIILEGFTNDWGRDMPLGTYRDSGNTSVCGCLRQAINYILTQKASALLVLVLDYTGRNYDGVDTSSLSTNASGKTQQEYYDELAKVAYNVGVPVIKLYQNSSISEFTPQYLLDNIHPTELGAKQTAYAIWQELKYILLKQR